MPKKELSRLESAKLAAQERFEAIRDRASDVHDQVTEYISDHPMTTTLLAFGVGMIAGAVLLKLMEKK